MTPLRLAALAGLAAATALPADAFAAKSFEGRTQQGRAVSVRVGDDNIVNRVQIAWRTRRCALRGSFFRDTTQFRSPLDTSTVDQIADAGAYTVRDRGGVRSRVRITLAGRRIFDAANPTAEAWQGTLRARIVVRKNGRTVDRCTLRSIGWRATLAT